MEQHVVLTAVVPQAEWRADPEAVLAAAHERLGRTAAARGTRPAGRVEEEVELIGLGSRVRITLRADVEAAPGSGAGVTVLGPAGARRRRQRR